MPTVDPRRLILVVSAFALVSCTGGGSSSSPPSATSATSRTPEASMAAPTASPSATVELAETPSPTAEASGSPSSNSVGVVTTAPPKPTNTTYVLVKETVNAAQTQIKKEYRATWVEPAGYATTFKVYGVTGCLRESEKNDNTPCVVEGMHIPSSKLKLLGTAAGDARSMTVTWTRYDEAGPDPYWAILLSASNKYGESKSAILTSGLVCFGCTY
jgi:hypothetical protein